MTTEKTDKTSWESEIWGKKSLMERSHINTNTYLSCWCPECGASLNQDGKAVFRIVNMQGDEGISRVSPYLNVLDRESTIHVDNDEELADVRCPHCDVSLIAKDQLCKKDHSKMVRFQVSVSDSIRLMVTLCVRRSCRWYSMSDEDNERLILRDSHEW